MLYITSTYKTKNTFWLNLTCEYNNALYEYVHKPSYIQDLYTIALFSYLYCPIQIQVLQVILLSK